MITLCIEQTPCIEVTGDVTSDTLGTDTFPCLKVSASTHDDVRLKPVNFDRGLALIRQGTFWVEPCFLAEPGDMSGRSFFVLYQREDGSYVVIYTLPGDEAVCELEGAENHQWLLRGRSYQPEQRYTLIIGTGASPYKLLENTANVVCDLMPALQLRNEKPSPYIVDHFGWCTWDAFYHAVDAEKVISGLESLQKAGIRPGWVIIDDGWQDVEGSTLKGLDADLEKFPDGLASIVSHIKQAFQIPMVGIWHTLQGYWHGLQASSELDQSYETVEVTTQRLHCPTPDDAQTVHFISEKETYRFFQHWYQCLAAKGVDFVKVDNQTSLVDAWEGQSYKALKLMRHTQEAVQSAARHYFSNNIIHCMCHAPEILYHLRSGNCWRNSDDFFPKKMELQQRHLVLNAYNALWTSPFAIPDWDMFWTTHQYAEMHAMARAVSGGPIYVSDKPGKTDPALVRKLMYGNGRLLRSDRPALPTCDCLFVDPQHEDQLLKVSNRSGSIGVMGIFHCKWSEEKNERKPISGFYSPSDIHDLDDLHYAIYEHRRGRLLTMDQNSLEAITLDFAQGEIVIFSPIHAGIAPLGLLDKFNSPAAIRKWVEFSHNDFYLELVSGGQVGFYSQRRPRKIMINDKQHPFQYHKERRLLSIDAMSDSPIAMSLHF